MPRLFRQHSLSSSRSKPSVLNVKFAVSPFYEEGCGSVKTRQLYVSGSVWSARRQGTSGFQYCLMETPLVDCGISHTEPLVFTTARETIQLVDRVITHHPFIYSHRMLYTFRTQFGTVVAPGHGSSH